MDEWNGKASLSGPRGRWYRESDQTIVFICAVAGEVTPGFSKGLRSSFSSCMLRLVTSEASQGGYDIGAWGGRQSSE
jgi:hypothetical protein